MKKQKRTHFDGGCRPGGDKKKTMLQQGDLPRGGTEKYDKHFDKGRAAPVGRENKKEYILTWGVPGDSAKNTMLQQGDLPRGGAERRIR